MAAPTNTFITTSVIGNREDLTNFIYRITPTQTPLLTMAAKTKATNTLHEWQTQDLAAAANNAQAEGDTLTATAATATVRLTNKTQISAKAISVSGTQIAMNHAGVKDELSYQLSLKSMEIKRDMEFALMQNNVTATAPRQARGMLGFSGDNSNGGTSYVAPVYTANPGTVQTDGTLRAFTEAQLKDVLQKVYTAGGMVDTLMMGPAQKQTFSTFTGNATRLDKSEDQKLYASIDVYSSDFGDLKAVPNRFQRTRDVFVIDSSKVAVAYFRPFQTIELATTGDAQQRELLCEYTLEVRNPKAHGIVADVS